MPCWRLLYIIITTEVLDVVGGVSKSRIRVEGFVAQSRVDFDGLARWPWHMTAQSNNTSCPYTLC